ncbi:hypothetical protein YYE_01341 [Plasmodium vinckei vinckei]|nr:hypothetical protein YYE_01341 [Plasmodium vinckei vinckei]
MITFREIDELFTNYETNDEQFNNGYGSYNNYCPVKNGSKRCETDFEKLSAISGHAYTELMQNDNIDLQSENDLSADFLVMGLSDRLYKLSKDHTLSIKDAFTKYLGKHMGSFNYWNILLNKKYFSGSNIGVMNGFYFLFKQICEAINRNNESNVEQYQQIRDITQCYIIYNTLYNYLNQCDPYLQLLNHSKTLYNEFIEAVIKHNNHDESVRDQIIRLSHIDTTKFGYEFNTEGCTKLHKKLTKKSPKFIRTVIKMLEDDEKRKNGDGSQSTEDNDDDDLFEDDDDDDLDEEEDDDELENRLQGTPPVPAPVLTTPIQKGSPDFQGVLNAPEGQLPNQDNSQKSSDSGQDNSASQTKELGGDIVDKPEQSQYGEQQNSGSKQGDSSGRTGDPPSEPHPPSQDGKSDIKNSLNQSETSNISEGSFGFWSSFLSLLSNGTKIFNRASDFIDQNQQRINDAKDKIIGAYKDDMDNLKTIYSASNDYFNSIIDNITTQLNQVGTPKSSSSGYNLPQSSDQPKKTGNPLTPQPSAPSIDSPAIIPPNPSQQNQSSPQPQSTTPVPSKTDTSTQKTTSLINAQLLNSPNSDPISRPPWNIIPTTWNGSGDCKPKIKFMNATLVCCTSDQCSLTGVSITFVLIPIIILILYKYFPREWTTKSEKKNMKRVIKLVDGSKKTQIIINSYYRKKNLKPVNELINDVVRTNANTINIMNDKKYIFYKIIYY